MAEEVEYESDPEETKLSLKMRRREASDDEEDGGGDGEDGGRRENLNSRRRIVDSDVESDGQGAAAEYENDEEEGEEEYVDEEIIDEDEYGEEEEGDEERRGDIGEFEVVDKEAEVGRKSLRMGQGQSQLKENRDSGKMGISLKMQVRIIRIRR